MTLISTIASAISARMADVASMVLKITRASVRKIGKANTVRRMSTNAPDKRTFVKMAERVRILLVDFFAFASMVGKANFVI